MSPWKQFLQMFGFGFLALCLIAFSGCNKVPTFGELTGGEQPEEEAETPVANPPAVNSEIPANPVAQPTDPPPTTNTAISPEQAISYFEFNKNTNTDEQLEKLRNDLGENTGAVTELDLSLTGVTTRGIAVLPEFENLQTLNLANTKNLTAEFAAEVAKCKSLQTLNMHRTTAVNDATLAIAVAGIPSLKSLDISYTSTTEASFEAIKPLAELEVLRISNTPIDGTRFTQLRKTGHWSMLKEFDASISNFGVNGTPGLMNLKNLEVLKLRKAYMTDKGLTALKTLKKVRVLDLSHNTFTDAGLVALLPLKKIEILELEGCKSISDASLNVIYKLENLQQLDVNFTGISTGALTQLKAKYLPNCTIRYSGGQL